MNNPKRVVEFVEEETSEIANTGQVLDLAKWAADEDLAVNDNASARREPRGYALLGLAVLGWIIVAGAGSAFSIVTGI